MLYSGRLNKLSVLSLQHHHLYTDLLLTYKFIHGLIDIPAQEVRLHLTISNTRSNGVCLVHQHPNSQKCAALFSSRMPPLWNALLINILHVETLNKFQKTLTCLFVSMSVILLTFTSCFMICYVRT